ncbi:ATP-binding protein [Arthrobacter cryoconiti]|uniref:ATP-binding protein n=1 Tax=Arthrobacter cryoconiti TaxID=748907 RepID=A0ABV8R738_9MICC|nr:ATP-binding protein [Arthrobacter cryoconiti]MCC9069366.1 ATP-binding protein [Arthrobacter cryoconiti]
MNGEVLQHVHDQLAWMTSEGGSLHRYSPRATQRTDRPFDLSGERLRFQRALLDELLSEGEELIQKEGFAAVVVTAGPPGAGKSTHIDEMHLADGWREIDADEIKIRLLKAALIDGRFDDFLTTNLADGHPIMMNELSSLVHNESVALADLMIKRCLERKENVVIQGTLSWEGLPPRYAQMLALYDYSSVTLLDIEVQQSVALERAFTRWSKGRIDTIAGRCEGGGRFTPTEAITSIYDASGRYSRCNQNTVDFFNAKGVEDLDGIRLIVCDGPANRTEYRRVMGDYTTPIPGYLKDQDKDIIQAGSL